MTVSWSWVGAVTGDEATITVRVASGSAVSVDVSTSPDLSSPDTYGPESVDSHGVAKVVLVGLNPDTTYYYRVAVDSTPDTGSDGSFRTFPAGAADLVIVHGTCQTHSRDGYVWDRIADRNPHILLHGGDLHYRDLADDDVATRMGAYDQAMATRFKAMLRTVPIAYVWDDHDYCGDASDRTADGRAAAQDAYRLAVPHYPLPDDDGIWQSFTLGRLRVVMLDSRSDRDPWTDTDNANKTMLGHAQKAWLKGELVAAQAAGQAVAILSSQSWHSATSDGWNVYRTERAELARFISERQIPVFILSGDIHAASMDDGTNSEGGIPEFMAAAFAQFASSATSPGIGVWSHGAALKGGVAYPDPLWQYGLTTITDDGTVMTVEWEAYHVDPDDGTETLLTSLTFSLTPWQSAAPLVWNGSGWVPAQPLVWNGSGWVPAQPLALV